MPFKVARLFENSKNRDALNGQLDFLVGRSRYRGEKQRIP